MKRIALAWILVSLIAGSAAAQTAYDDEEPMAPRSSDVILKGVGPQFGLNQAPAPAPAPSTEKPQTQMVMSADPHITSMATCDRCGHEWSECKCDGHGCTVFIDWLLLHPRGFNPVFAQEGICSGPGSGFEQIDFNNDSGFRLGVAKTCHDPCTEIGMTWWHHEFNDGESVSVVAPDSLFPLLLHPAFGDCDDFTSTSAEARASINVDRVYLDCRRYIDLTSCCTLDYAVGFAWGQLNQDLTAEFDTATVLVDTDSWGYGVHLGVGSEYGRGCCRGFGRMDLTLLGTATQGHFRQLDIFDGELAELEETFDRIVPVLDLELGVAVDISKCMVLKVGYMASFWWNVVTPSNFVQHIQSGDVSAGDVEETVSFDGVFARLEFKW